MARLVFFLLSLCITFLWVDSEKLLMTAEEGMFFYSPERAFTQSLSIWHESGTGNVSAAQLPQVPTLALIASLSQVFGKAGTQAIVIFILLFIGMYGAYLLASLFIRKKQICLILLKIPVEKRWFTLINIKKFLKT